MTSKAKKVLIPKRIYACQQCPKNWSMLMTIDGESRQRYICEITGEGRDGDFYIPESCPLENWNEDEK